MNKHEGYKKDVSAGWCKFVRQGNSKIGSEAAAAPQKEAIGNLSYFFALVKLNETRFGRLMSEAGRGRGEKDDKKGY